MTATTLRLLTAVTTNRWSFTILLLSLCSCTHILFKMFKRAMSFNYTPFPLNPKIRYEGCKGWFICRCIDPVLTHSQHPVSMTASVCVFLSPASAHLHVSADGYSCRANTHTHTHTDGWMDVNLPCWERSLRLVLSCLCNIHFMAKTE